MQMKKLFFGLLAFVALVGCEKDPDLDKVQDDYIVYTQYDKSAGFSTFKTFYVPDSILLIGNSGSETYLTSAGAQSVINAYKTNMEQRGFREVSEKDDADLGLQLSYIENTQYVSDWWGGDYPWLGYDDYWGPGYWNPLYDGWGWYYPYPITYSFSTGTLMGELVDLMVPGSASATSKIPVVWSSLISGFVYGSGSLNANQTITSVNQAFAQSPYLKTTPVAAANNNEK